MCAFCRISFKFVIGSNIGISQLLIGYWNIGKISYRRITRNFIIHTCVKMALIYTAKLEDHGSTCIQEDRTAWINVCELQIKHF